MESLGNPYARQRRDEEYLHCELCHAHLLVGDEEHCPRGECGAQERCAEHACLCSRPLLLDLPCACGHARSEHLDAPGGPAGSYAGPCAYAACCHTFAPAPLADSAVVEVAEEPGRAGTGAACSWGEFLESNLGAESRADPGSLVGEVEAALVARGEYRGGGGAAPMFVVRLVAGAAS